jgi:hypothetical protein
VDHDEHLAQHDEQIKHLVALNVKMVEANERLTVAIEGINQSLAIVTQLLQRVQEDDQRNGA